MCTDVLIPHSRVYKDKTRNEKFNTNTLYIGCMSFLCYYKHDLLKVRLWVIEVNPTISYNVRGIFLGSGFTGKFSFGERRSLHR